MGTCEYFTKEHYERNGNNADFQTHHINEKNALNLLALSILLTETFCGCGYEDR